MKFLIKAIQTLISITAFNFVAVNASPMDLDNFITDIEFAFALSDSPKILEFYKNRGYEPIWTSSDNASRERIKALIFSIETASSHGLPFGDAEVSQIVSLAQQPRTTSNLTIAEAKISKIFVQFATSLHSGMLEPQRVAKNISRNSKPPSVEDLFAGILGSNPYQYIRDLPPNSYQYRILRKELKRLNHIIKKGGWGVTVNSKGLRLGDAGEGVLQLRNRLIRMGYMRASPNPEYNHTLAAAVKKFQINHGLEPDGIAGKNTLTTINVSPEARRKQVIAALERERWLNQPLGDDHILVNIANFNAEVYSYGNRVFSTRVVVGQSRNKLQTPEFSDQLTYIVLNPTWHVPRSITVGEILPELQKDPTAESQLLMFNQDGGIVDREGIDFTSYSRSNFPFAFKQPPGPKNALGRVKFMFPNKFNVYMHDTQERSLFQKEIRNYSHGCIRVHRADEFAKFLLDQVVKDPESTYNSVLASGKESVVKLPVPLPVHITYQSAFVGDNGDIQYRIDVYGRDNAVYENLFSSDSTSS